MLNPRLQALFDDYASSHQHPTNRLTHKVAIPAIVLHIVACLFLIAVVLLQQGKNQDLASAFGGGGTQTAFDRPVMLVLGYCVLVPLAILK